jgi:hypothetical protein
MDVTSVHVKCIEGCDGLQYDKICRNFRGNYCLHLQGRKYFLKTVVGSSEMSMNVYRTRRFYIPDAP